MNWMIKILVFISVALIKWHLNKKHEMLSFHIGNKCFFYFHIKKMYINYSHISTIFAN